MKAGPSSHDSLRVSHVSLVMSRRLSAESSRVKNLLVRRVRHFNETFPKTPDSTSHTLLLCGVFKNKPSRASVGEVSGLCSCRIGFDLHPISSEEHFPALMFFSAIDSVAVSQITHVVVLLLRRVQNRVPDIRIAEHCLSNLDVTEDTNRLSIIRPQRLRKLRHASNEYP